MHRKNHLIHVSSVDAIPVPEHVSACCGGRPSKLRWAPGRFRGSHVRNNPWTASWHDPSALGGKKETAACGAKRRSEVCGKTAVLYADTRADDTCFRYVWCLICWLHLVTSDESCPRPRRLQEQTLRGPLGKKCRTNGGWLKAARRRKKTPKKALGR